MLDLKIYDEDQYDLVPVPLPGRLIVFAGPDGLMCRRNDGTIAAYPAAAGGGSGAAEFLTLPLRDGGTDYGDYPPEPAPGFVQVVATPTGIKLLDSNKNWIVGGQGGGGLSEPIQSLRFSELGDYANMPNHGINGEATFGYVFGELVKQLPSGVVEGIDGSTRWAPTGGGGGAPE